MRPHCRCSMSRAKQPRATAICDCTVGVVTKWQAESCYRVVISKINAYNYTANVINALLEQFLILK